MVPPLLGERAGVRANRNTKKARKIPLPGLRTKSRWKRNVILAGVRANFLKPKTLDFGLWTLDFGLWTSNR